MEFQVKIIAFNIWFCHFIYSLCPFKSCILIFCYILATNSLLWRNSHWLFFSLIFILPVSPKVSCHTKSHKIIQLETVVRYSEVLWRKCYLFILDLTSVPSPESCSTILGLWHSSVVFISLVTVQMNFSEGLFFTANHLLLGSNKYSKSHLLALCRIRK